MNKNIFNKIVGGAMKVTQAKSQLASKAAGMMMNASHTLIEKGAGNLTNMGKSVFDLAKNPKKELDKFAEALKTPEGKAKMDNIMMTGAIMGGIKDVSAGKAGYKLVDFVEEYNKTGEIPKALGDFKAKYVATNGWRGYYDAVPKPGTGWEKIDSNWMTGDWSDAGENAGSEVAKKIAALAQKLAAEGKEMVMVNTPTSNVFSVGYDIFTRLIK